MPRPAAGGCGAAAARPLAGPRPTRRGGGAGGRAAGATPPPPRGVCRRPRPARWQSPVPASGGPPAWDPGGASCAISSLRSSSRGTPAQSSCGRHTGWARSAPPACWSAAPRAAPHRRRATQSRCRPQARRGKPARRPPTGRPGP